MGRKASQLVLVFVLLSTLWTINGNDQVSKRGLPPQFGERGQAALPDLFYADDSSLVSTATVEGRLAVFDDAWETSQERYYDPAFHGIDWQAKRATFRP